MLAERSMNQTINKLKRLTDTLKKRIFLPVAQAEITDLYQTTTPLHQIPGDDCFGPLPENGRWGGEGVYGWFKGRFTVPAALEGKALFLYPRMTYYEATLWLNGCIHSNFAAKFVDASHGNHYCNRITPAARTGDTYQIDLECYAYHEVPGTMPLEENNQHFLYQVGPVDICLRNDELMQFYFDLKTVLSLRAALPLNSFRRAEVENALYQAHMQLFYDPACCTEAQFRDGILAAWPYLTAILEKKNGDTNAWVGLIGHSHMDTAWLWPILETKKKCARTYANQLNLMEEYPEYTFVQSSAYHSDIIRRHYPELFQRIQQAVKDGRYEPNGGVWVECDCNLTGGEYMLRQFVWGQRFTQKYFDYTADTFWLPDTFGYSLAIPQIMKGCKVDYFLTTKMAWGDTNIFPYTSFLWQGIDGTRILAHLNRTHIGPTPETLHEITDGGDAIKERRTAPMRLFSYGKGDGGGGPEFEEIEMARRLTDLEGVPRSGHETVSSFMHRLQDTIHQPSIYADELYLELHRATLTNQHEIKRGNRLLEIALHHLELATVQQAVAGGIAADGAEIQPLMNTLLVHQFHDILPGTCIHSVHDLARKAVAGALEQARAHTLALLPGSEKPDAVTLYNPLGFENRDTFYLPARGRGIQHHLSQAFTDLEGRECLAVYGPSLPAFGACSLIYTDAPCQAPSPFQLDGPVLTTPFARITFNEEGFIASFIDLATGRELVQGLPFGTFLMAEDLPSIWDNWDIDADLEDKFAPAGHLISRKVVSQGPVELRIRCKWQLSENSAITQDMIFSAHSPRVSFDTQMDWQMDHRFLKTAFDTAIHADGVRNEIQFGHIRRSNHRSTSIEKARFEICNHKYSDLSELNYGIALLNDCKYGLSVREGSMRLSLHKGGLRPDKEGDKGLHRCRYALLPHQGGFGSETVIQPAYQFNYLPLIRDGQGDVAPLAAIDQPNTIIETVKPCEDAEQAYILRIYEAAGDWTKASLSFSHPVKKMALCNMLEEEEGPAENALTFRPFEIKTLKVFY